MCAYYHERRGRTYGYRFVKLTKDGRSKEYSFARIMANTFLGGVPDGHGVYHKNGMKSECALYNLIVLPRKRIGEITGPRCAKRVVMKIDAQGEAIEFYRSTRQAGEANHMSYQAVLDRIHGRVKRPFELNGFTFQYEE